MEEMTERWLIANGILYRRDDQSQDGTQLDFYLEDFDVYIEVKRFHTPRIAAQMSRAENVIAVQGFGSLQFLEHLVNWRQLRPTRAPASSNGRTPDFESGNARSTRAAGTTPAPPHGSDSP